ncbi:MAG TPA: ornithine decarboxylase, partial [Sutterella sp.]|nr:ornithine decarboxylase [Sutterella sp.]
GILVTQSVHKQLAGFSMVSQVHKKDAHIKGQARYVPHKRMNSSFLFQSSTSPFYPMFAALDVNAKMHEGDAAEIFWHACVIEGINARKAILKRCSKIRPFINPTIDGKPWESFDSETIASDIRFFAFDPKDAWHGFKGYGHNQYFVDPCKLLLTTPGVNPETGAYEDEGIPANVLAAFLRTRNIIPEKCDLNSLLILITPAESETKLARLVDALVEFEDLIDRDAPLEEVLPEVLAAYPERYRGYSVKALCADIFALYKKHDMKRLLQEMFREESLPRVAMLAHEAQLKFFRGETEYVALKDAQGRIAAEGALPYPPGVFCCVAGEVWSGAALKYFLAIEDAVNATPGFRPEVQGVYFEKEANGSLRLYANVIKA